VVDVVDELEVEELVDGVDVDDDDATVDNRGVVVAGDETVGA
jgi:hypothetical protein